MERILLINSEKCLGCLACVMTCSIVKEKTFNRTKARIHVVKAESRWLNIPFVCEHCTDPPCLDVCSTGALKKDPKTEIVKVDIDICTGCKACVEVCPFEAIGVSSSTGKVFICDLCNGDPECAKVCMPEAISYVPVDKTTVMEKQRSADNRLEILATIRRS